MSGGWDTITAWRKLRIAKLPSGLELWFNEEGAYTVPARSDHSEVEQTLTEVDAWAKTRRPAHPDAVEKWLEIFEDQYPYLSKGTPRRQKTETFRESTRHMIARVMAGLDSKNP